MGICCGFLAPQHGVFAVQSPERYSPLYTLRISAMEFNSMCCGLKPLLEPSIDCLRGKDCVSRKWGWFLAWALSQLERSSTSRLTSFFWCFKGAASRAGSLSPWSTSRNISFGKLLEIKYFRELWWGTFSLKKWSKYCHVNGVSFVILTDLKRKCSPFMSLNVFQQNGLV